MAVGFPTKANWAAGDVLTAAQMDDLAGTVNTLQYSGYPIMAGKNAVINGNFDIWQKNTSSTSSGYSTADRWYSSGTGFTFSQESSIVPTGAKYSMKLLQGSGTNAFTLNQAIESLNAIPYAGQTVTVSVSFAASASTTFGLSVYYSTSTDVGPTGSWTAITASSGTTSTTVSTTTFVRISAQYAIPSTAKSLLVVPNGTVTNGTAAYVGQVQFELGSVATTFARAGGTFQGELAACQRYYWRASGLAYNRYSAFGIGASGTIAQVVVPNPVPMRVAPTSIDYAGIGVFDTTTLIACTPTIDTAGVNATVILATVASGVTQYRPYHLLNNNNSSGYLGFSAEL